MARLCPLFSGSSGNSYFLGSKEAGILIDAGRSAKQITEMLGKCQIDPLSLQGIFVTHEHQDHVSGLRVFAAKYQIPVFASLGTVQALIDGKIANDSFPIFAIEEELQLAGMTVSPFHTSHDSAESLGFRVKTADHKVFTLATDLGYLSEEVIENLTGCDYAVLESNHDIAMLQTGPYPYPLKRRILSDTGHLSNKSCAEFLPSLHKSGTRKYLLAHISSENNTPDIAYQSSLCSMVMSGLVKDEDFTL
ncbi:MAG: MBL fold metallo-hydrolase, partial [Oscillospiraceae bacterium]